MSTPCWTGLVDIVRKLIILFLLCVGLAACGGTAKGPVVLAAASLEPALEEISDAWVAQGHDAPTLSFAGSSSLARQIESGAPADLFLSADEDWADYLERKGRVAPGSRVTLLGNRLALVAARDDDRMVEIAPGFPLAKLLGEHRLAVADTDAVPAGKYAKAALQSLGVWDQVSGKLAPAENVRAALAMVERGQAPLGIVYATDAAGSDKVRLLGLFPSSSHPPIHYPLVTIAGSHSTDAQAFRSFLMSPPARAIFTRYGFEVL